MTYRYKPTVQAIQYTGDINKVIEFIGGNNIECLKWHDNDEHIEIRIRGGDYYRLPIGYYLTKHTYDSGEVRYETIGQLTFDVNYEKAAEPESIVGVDLVSSASCSVTNSVIVIPKENQQLYDKVDLLIKYDNWRKQHDPVVLDWMNFGQEKWSIQYKHDLRSIACNWAVRYQNIGALYFSTESLAEQFYAEHKDLIHRVWG